MLKAQGFTSRADAVLRVGVGINVAFHLGFAAVALWQNHDFSVGDQATTAKVLGVDFNGWHAMVGILLFAPALYALRRTDLTLWWTGAAMFSVLASVGIFVIDDSVFGLIPLANLSADVIYHVLSAGSLGLVVLAYLLLNRVPPSSEIAGSNQRRTSSPASRS